SLTASPGRAARRHSHHGHRWANAPAATLLSRVRGSSQQGPQLRLDDLAGGVARQARQEADHARHLVGRQPIPAMLLQRLGADLHRTYDESRNLLAELG